VRWCRSLQSFAFSENLDFLCLTGRLLRTRCARPNTRPTFAPPTPSSPPSPLCDRAVPLHRRRADLLERTREHLTQGTLGGKRAAILHRHAFELRERSFGTEAQHPHYQGIEHLIGYRAHEVSKLPLGQLAVEGFVLDAFAIECVEAPLDVRRRLRARAGKQRYQGQ